MNDSNKAERTNQALLCTCGSMRFWTDEPIYNTAQNLTTECECTQCYKKWIMKLDLIPLMPAAYADNIRDAGPSAFGGRNAGTRRDS